MLGECWFYICHWLILLLDYSLSVSLIRSSIKLKIWIFFFLMAPAFKNPYDDFVSYDTTLKMTTWRPS